MKLKRILCILLIIMLLPLQGLALRDLREGDSGAAEFKTPPAPSTWSTATINMAAMRSRSRPKFRFVAVSVILHHLFRPYGLVKFFRRQKSQGQHRLF